jgi:hypothetical protein
LEGKTGWERVHSWRSTIQFKYDFVSYLNLQKWDIPCKQCHMLISHYIVTWAHTWGNGTGHTSVTYFCLWLLPYQFFCLSCPLFLLKRFLLHTHKTPSCFIFLQRKPFQSLFESKILQRVQSIKCKIHKGHAMVFQCKYFNWKCKHISQFTHLVRHVLLAQVWTHYKIGQTQNMNLILQGTNSSFEELNEKNQPWIDSKTCKCDHVLNWLFFP